MKWSSDGIGLTPEDASKVTDIGTTFQGNTEITSFEELELFNGVLEIGRLAFKSCENLTKIKLPYSVTTIGADSFRFTKIESLAVVDSVIDIHDEAFRNNSNMKIISIGPNVKNMGWELCTGNGNMLKAIMFATEPPIIKEDTIFRGSYPIYVPDESIEAYKTATNWTTMASRIVGLSQMRILDSAIFPPETSSQLLDISFFFYVEKIVPNCVFTPDTAEYYEDKIIFKEQGLYAIDAYYNNTTLHLECNYNPSYPIIHGWLLSTDGVINPSPFWSTVGFLQCQPGTTIEWGCIGASQGTLCEYDSSGAFKDYWLPNQNPRQVKLTSSSTMLKAGFSTEYLHKSYIKDITNNKIIWKGHSVEL